MQPIIKSFQIPFDKNGNMLSYAPEWEHDGIEWVDNKKFSDDLSYYGYEKNSRYPHLVFKSVTTGKKYPMYLPEFDRVMKNKIIQRGVLSGYFTFIRRGQTYGISLIVDDIDER